MFTFCKTRHARTHLGFLDLGASASFWLAFWLAGALVPPSPLPPPFLEDAGVPTFLAGCLGLLGVMIILPSSLGWSSEGEKREL